MFTPSSTSSQELLLSLYNRRLLLNSMVTAASPPAASATINHDTSETYIKPSNGFDANVVMVLSVLLCALICSLGLNAIVRCALRCSNIMAREPNYDENNDDNNNNNHQRVNSAILANTGIKKAALKTFPTISFSPDLKMPGLDTECVICLSEFVKGERVRLLPKCHHGFHVRCIDKWLNSHSSCPTCRSCLIETCQKIVGCNQASSSQPPRRPQPPPPPPQLPTTLAQTQETIINMAPLEREDMMHT